MIRWFRRYRNIFWIGITVAMLLSIVGAGGLYLTNRDVSDAVAVVGGVKIPYLYYRQIVDRSLDELRKQKKEVTDDLSKEVKQEVLQSLLTSQMCALRAKEMGLGVSDEELAWAIHQDKAFQNNGTFDQTLYIQTVLQGYHSTVEEFEAQLRQQLAASKYQRLVFTAVKLAPGEILEEYKISHKGSDKNFTKDREAFIQSLHRVRALSTLQADLRRSAERLGIRIYLQEREGGG